MSRGLTNRRIAGGAILIFFAILLAVGIHHILATGTCSSTGYAADLGPVPKCPSGTGWWILFLMSGIFGSLIGAGLVGNIAIAFVGLFGGIGVGALSLVFERGHSSGDKVFSGIFGGAFALVALGALVFVLRSLREALRGGGSAAAPAGSPRTDRAGDPIMAAYQGSSAQTVAAAAGLSSPSAVSFAGSARSRPTGGGGGGSLADELEKLAELRRTGALSQAEFDAAKARLLGPG